MSKARDLANAGTALTSVSATELGYVDGVTSAIQTQLDAKTAKSTLTTTGDIYYASAANTPARLGIGSTANVLTVSGGVPVWSAPAGGGKVLQVVQATYSTATTNTTTTYADTGLTASITPSSTSSRILVTVSQPMFTAASGSYGVGGTFKIMRGATNIVTDVPNGYYATASGTADREGQAVFSYSYVDSPATTSSTTYKTQFKKGQGDSVQTNGQMSTIILMEIGA